MWEIIIGDKQLAKIIFEHLLEVIQLTLPYQEKEIGGTITRTETHTPKAVSSVIWKHLKCNHLESKIKSICAFLIHLCLGNIEI